MIVKAFPENWFDRPWYRLPLASPFAPFGAFRDELERLLSAQVRDWDGALCEASPNTAVFELEDEGAQLKLTAKLPGMLEKDLELKLTADSVVLKGERKVSVPEGYKTRRRERENYRFERAIRLACRIDPDKAEASLVNGVLTVTMPKAESAKARSITVRTT